MIKVVNIYKSFKDRLILNNINFEVNKGETLVIIGGSGSGKSTLLKLLIGLLRPEQGHRQKCHRRWQYALSPRLLYR